MAVGVGASLGANLPQNYAEWTAYQRRAGKLGTGKGQIAPNQMKTAFDAYVKNHGIVTPAAQRAAEAQSVAQQQAQKQAALQNQPSAIDFKQESGEFQALNAKNLAELQRYAGVGETSPGVWGMVGVGELQRNQANTKAQNDISRAELAQALANRLQTINRNAAARGVSNSGIRLHGRQDSVNQYKPQFGRLDLSDTQAANATQYGIADAITSYFLNTFGAEGKDKAASVLAALKSKGIIT